MHSAKSWPKPTAQRITSGTWVRGTLWRGWKKRSIGLQSRNPWQQLNLTYPASLQQRYINRGFFIINMSRYESPGVTASSPLLLQTHAIHTQWHTEQARSAYSEPQGLKFCLWEIWELSWERDMAIGSFLLLEKCNWPKPNCTKLHGFLTTSVKQSQTVSKQMVLMTAKAFRGH